MYGKCPKCGETVTHLAQQQINVGPTLTETGLPATVISCSRCQTILGVIANYWAQVDDIANQVVERLKKQASRY